MRIIKIKYIYTKDYRFYNLNKKVFAGTYRNYYCISTYCRRYIYLNNKFETYLYLICA